MKPKMLLLLISLTLPSTAPAQVAQTSNPPAEDRSAKLLLEQTAENYKTLMGYEIHGTLNMQVPGSIWQFNGEITLVGPRREVQEDGTVKMVPGAGGVGRLKPIQVAAGSEEKPALVSAPFQILGRFNAIAKGAIQVERTGSEVLQLNGEGVSCEVLKVTYTPSTYENLHPEEVTYWIDPARHLVLKKVLMFNAGRSIPRALWTIAYDSAKFDQPPPQWALDMQNIPEVKLRSEWIGKEAPEFSLPAADGSPVMLSSLRGRVVLLNFWSITCGPCKLEMPMLEEVGGENESRGVVLLGISFDPTDKSKAWQERNKRSMRTLTDADFVVSDAYKLHGIPALVLVGRDGKIRQYWEGTVSKAVLQAALDQTLKK
jgi:peroxiredoxin